MSRGLASATVTALGAQVQRPVTLVSLAFDSGTIYAHDGVGSLSFDGQTWSGVGALIDIGPMEESDDRSARRVWVRVNGTTQSLLDEALDNDIYGRRVTIYHGALDASGALEADPDIRWQGFMDTSEVDVGGDEDVITLFCEDERIRDERPNGVLFSDEDQQRIVPGDTGFEFIPQLIDRRVTWGPDGNPTSFGGSLGVNTGGPIVRDRTRRTSR